MTVHASALICQWSAGIKAGSGLPESLRTLGSLEVKGQVTLALLLSSRRLAFISGGFSCFKHDFKQAVRSDSHQPRS